MKNSVYIYERIFQEVCDENFGRSVADYRIYYLFASDKLTYKACNGFYTVCSAFISWNSSNLFFTTSYQVQKGGNLK